jgi:hypothetical protein
MDLSEMKAAPVSPLLDSHIALLRDNRAGLRQSRHMLLFKPKLADVKRADQTGRRYLVKGSK